MKVWRKTNESDVLFGIDLRRFFLRTAGEARNKPLVPPISARIHISSEITQLALRPSTSPPDPEAESPVPVLLAAAPVKSHFDPDAQTSWVMAHPALT